ncbi:hypothetical protein BC830DRAFT_1201862 [Chytriomyces sp. MP71]|nr:hypothetical protein BC830DRAFT_1201862 [Chytriomyces sp. MP71]
MRSSVLTVLVLVLCACLALPVLAWEKEDYAIFDLHDKLVKIKGVKDSKGRRNDFYSVLEVLHTATPIQISRAYRKASLELHPDKNPAPEAASLYALLTSINGVLKDKEMRERYDKHRKTGIPTWRGTGYYIARYKPGLAFILSFLVVVISIGQYATQWAQFYQVKHKIEMTVVDVVETKTSNDLTYNNLRKMLKRAGIEEVPLAVKRAIRNGVAVAEILKMPELEGLITIEQQEEEFRDEAAESLKVLEAYKPTINKTLIVQLPETILSIPTVIANFGKQRDVSSAGEEVENAEEEVEGVETGSKKTAKKSIRNEVEDGELESAEKKPVKAKKKTVAGFKSSTGEVLTKAELIKKLQKEQAKLSKSE